MSAHPQTPLPQSSEWLARWFTWYSRRYARKHFHSLRVGGLFPRNPPESMVFFSNHGSWWDPIIATLLRQELFADKHVYAPVDAVALEKYKFFKKLGFFPVEKDTPRGAVQFLKTSERVLSEPGHILWVTPQGRFADVRERPVRFKNGLGHLAARFPGVRFVPVAIECVFWEEPRPEILVKFGMPIQADAAGLGVLDPATWTRFFEKEMERTQDALAEMAMRRDPAEFKNLLDGKAGVSGVYDAWRQFRALLAGSRYKLQHGTK